eukprot:Transcript_17898.p3 GENE.Transcript_17898~~Transcript_17898.p3  ORF type:complete len:140 (-),score=53.31 Transcript_17898:47-466(-)
MCGGAGTSRDPLLAAVRRSLRVEHGFPVGPRRMPPPWGVPAIYSIEEVDAPAPRAEDKAADGSWSNCEARFGTAGFVTGTFGLAAASVVTRLLATAAPLPEGRAAVAAALPPDRSIARPVAQRISERHAYRAAKAAAEP